MNKLKQRTITSFNLTNDLLDKLEHEQLQLNIPNAPSNTIGDQYWCIVGARESYVKAIQHGHWQGFNCSVKDQFDKEELLTLLQSTLRELGQIDFKNFSDGQISLAFDLLEHEVQHHGQLIRFTYANKLQFPKSWTDRYTV